MTEGKTRVLVINDGPMAYLPGLCERFPQCDFLACREDESVAHALARVQPEIVYGLHGGRYPASSHAPALDCPSVRWMHNGGAGIDHLPDWDEGRVTVTNSAGISSRFMAETVVGAILMMNFGFPRYMEQQRAHLWLKQPWQSLSSKTVLVIGLGGIGRLVAERLRLFGAHVIGLRASARPCDQVDEQITFDGLDQALARADYVCIHVPKTDATENLVDARFLSRMKPGARLVNTSRGAQVDEAALIEAIERGALAGAYLDVFREEPLPADSPLWDLPGVVITPHHSDAAQGWEMASAWFFEENLQRYLRREPLGNICSPGKGY